MYAWIGSRFCLPYLLQSSLTVGTRETNRLETPKEANGHNVRTMSLAVDTKQAALRHLDKHNRLQNKQFLHAQRNLPVWMFQMHVGMCLRCLQVLSGL